MPSVSNAHCNPVGLSIRTTSSVKNLVSSNDGRSPVTASFSKSPLSAFLNSPRVFLFGPRNPIFPENGLPNEILMKIVGYIYTPPRYKTRYGTLDYEEALMHQESKKTIFSCLTVNRQFYAVAKYILTSEPDFQSIKSFNKFIYSLKSCGPEITISTNFKTKLTTSNLVRHLSFTPHDLQRSLPPKLETIAADRYLPYGISDGTLLLLSNLFPKLTHVSLKHCCKVTDSSVIVLISLLGHRLQALDLEGCYEITDDVCRAIGQNCKRLTRLSLRSCTNISDIGLNAIRLNCMQLEHIDISFCTNISNDVISTFIKSYSVQTSNSMRAYLQSLHLAGLRIPDLPDLLKLLTPRDTRLKSRLVSLEISLMSEWGHDETTGIAYIITSLPETLCTLMLHEELDESRPITVELPEVITDGALLPIDFEALAIQCRRLHQFHLLNPSSITDDKVGAILGTNTDMVDLVLKQSRAITLRGIFDIITGSACVSRIRRLDISSASIAYKKPKPLSGIPRPRFLPPEPRAPLPAIPLSVEELSGFLQRGSDDGYVFQDLKHLGVPSIGSAENAMTQPCPWTREAFVEIGSWCEDLIVLELRLFKQAIPIFDENTGQVINPEPVVDDVRLVGSEVIKSLMNAVGNLVMWEGNII